MGRRLNPGERVHHINGDKMDYRIENLCLCPNTSAHKRLHQTMQDVGMKLYGLGVIEFDGTGYVVNEEKLAECLASIEPSAIPDPIPHLKDSE